MLKSLFLFVLNLTPSSVLRQFSAPPAQTVSHTAFPIVQLDHGTFFGAKEGNVRKFLGIPYAQPPVGDLRLRHPVPHDPYRGNHDATFFGISCPQQVAPLAIPEGFEYLADNYIGNYLRSQSGPWGEDCLTINIWTPDEIAPNTSLPVVTWIHGGGFIGGGSSKYDGSPIVKQSLDLGEAVIFVSLNYRLNAFGFLGGAEIKEAGLGNLGLCDQRQALRWIQRYISAFGGDPSKVTLWGQSAGSMSSVLQMLTNDDDNEGLFRGAFLQSGSLLPVGDITKGQEGYDHMLSYTSCRASRNTLQCLREAPYELFQKAVNAAPHILSYQALHLPWMPRIDGSFVGDNLFNMTLAGKLSNVPFVIGGCDDEATIFAIYQLNITTDAQTKAFIKSNYLSAATDAHLERLSDLYPDDVAQGSPFDTGDRNALTPQFKRLAAFQGDFVFQGPRRFLLQQRPNSGQLTWAYLSKLKKDTIPFGSFHGSDLPTFFEPGGIMVDYLINFVNHLDPNGPTVKNWTPYTTSGPQLLTLVDGSQTFTLVDDTFRHEAIDFLAEISTFYPI